MLKLTEQRYARNWSQAEVGRRVGVHNATVSYWESGRSRPSGRSGWRLSKVFGMPLDELLQSVNDDDRVSSNADAVA